jgi:hypothetical protein
MAHLKNVSRLVGRITTAALVVAQRQMTLQRRMVTKAPHPADIKPPDAAPPAGRVRRLKKDDCVICMDRMVLPKKLDCGHSFCKECIDQYFKNGQPKCPSCGKIFGVLKGNQPPGTFNWKVKPISLAGYPGCRAIEITYNIPDGIQTVREYALFV